MPQQGFPSRCSVSVASSTLSSNCLASSAAPSKDLQGGSLGFFYTSLPLVPPSAKPSANHVASGCLPTRVSDNISYQRTCNLTLAETMIPAAARVGLLKHHMPSLPSLAFQPPPQPFPTLPAGPRRPHASPSLAQHATCLAWARASCVTIVQCATSAPSSWALRQQSSAPPWWKKWSSAPPCCRTPQ